jgi:hypothetical protein
VTQDNGRPLVKQKSRDALQGEDGHVRRVRSEPDMIAIQPMQWSRLQDLHDVSYLDASDAACMEEARDVLARHRLVARIGPGGVGERPHPRYSEVPVPHRDADQAGAAGRAGRRRERLGACRSNLRARRAYTGPGLFPR